MPVFFPQRARLSRVREFNQCNLPSGHAKGGGRFGAKGECGPGGAAGPPSQAAPGKGTPGRPSAADPSHQAPQSSYTGPDKYGPHELHAFGPPKSFGDPEKLALAMASKDRDTANAARQRLMSLIPDVDANGNLSGPIPRFLRNEIHRAQEVAIESFNAHDGKDSKQFHSVPRLDGNGQEQFNAKGELITNYTEDRYRMQQEIIDKIFAANGAKDKQPNPTITVMGGLPGAGKTHSVLSRMQLQNKVVINADDIKEMLPEFNGNNANFLHEESSDIAKRALRIAANAGYNVIFDGTMSKQDSVDKTLKAYRGAGYRIEARLVDVPVGHSLKSALVRFYGGQVQQREKDKSDALDSAPGLVGKKKSAHHGGRLVPPDFIIGGVDPNFGSKPRMTFEAMKDTFHAWELVDGTAGGTRPKIVSTFGQLTEANAVGGAIRRRVPLLVAAYR